MRNVSNTSVAVIGGAGFLGSHLVNHLIEDRECIVLVIDNLVAGRREFVHPKAFFEYADITQSETYLRHLFEDYEVRYVFNYAAYPYIPVSFARPLHVFAVNANGALNVINAAQDAGAEGILQVSSAEIYGQGGECPLEQGKPNLKDRMPKMTEQWPSVPHSSYGAAKAAIDSMVRVRWREAKTPCIALRQFNCLGERETHPYVVPEIISQLAKLDPDACGTRPDGTKVLNDARLRLGNNSFRDFLYAGDAVRAAVELLEKGQFGEVYNLGSEDGIKIYDLAAKITKLMGFGEVWIDMDKKKVRPWEIWHLCSCNDKIHSVINYRSKVSLEESLKKTIEYFNGNGKRWCWEK